MRSKRIDIVMPTWNQSDCTIECIESIIAYTLVPYRLIWVDDGSDRHERDKVIEYIKKSGIEYKTIFFEENRGPTKAMNAGIQACESEYLAMINNDILVTNGWLGKLVLCLDDNSAIGMISALSATGRADWKQIKRCKKIILNGIDNPNKKDPIIISYDGLNPEIYFNNLEPMYYKVPKNLQPFCCLLRLEMLNEIGLFNEGMKVFGQDNEFSDRVRSSRWSKAVAVNCYIHHKRHVTVSTLKEKIKMRHRDYEALARVRTARKQTTQPQKAGQVAKNGELNGPSKIQ